MLAIILIVSIFIYLITLLFVISITDIHPSGNEKEDMY